MIPSQNTPGIYPITVTAMDNTGQTVVTYIL
jgi:hypothetical protein